MQRLIAISLSAMLSVPIDGQAQKVVPFLVGSHDTAECNAALAELKAGKSASSLPLHIADCGDAGVEHVATAMLEQSASMDTSYWRDLSNVLYRLRDERVFTAATSVAVSTASSSPARLVALGVLWNSLGHALNIDAWHDVPVVPAGQFDAACIQLSSRPTTIVKWRAPAGDVARRVATVLDALLDNRSTPGVVRRSASCMRAALSDVPRFLAPNAATVSYVCDNDFDLHVDTSRHRSTVEIELSGETSARQLLWKGVSTHRLTLSSPRDLVVSSAGQIVAKATHGHHSCLAGRYRTRGWPIPLAVDTLAGWARK